MDRPSGRLHHLPRALRESGHQVHVALISHGGDDLREEELGGVATSSRDVRRLGIAGALRNLHSLASQFRPDWVIGCSDAWTGYVAKRVADRCGARLAIDAYDDYEAYMPWNLPLHWAWRRAIGAADAVTAAGPQLASHLQRHRKSTTPVAIVPMAADPEFRPLDRVECRRHLGLPQSVPLIGYSGSWARNRGTDVLLRAFEQVRRQKPEARLVLSGRPPAYASSAEGVIALGYIDDADLPALINAVDVSCVITADTRFGRCSYPAKLCEAMACGVPVVATATQPVGWMLGDDPRFLGRIGDGGDIAARMLANLGMDRVDYGPVPSWPEAAIALRLAIGA